MAIEPCRGLHRTALGGENYRRGPCESDRCQCRAALQGLQSQRRHSTASVRSFETAGICMFTVANQWGDAVAGRPHSGILRPISPMPGVSTGSGRYTRRVEACKCSGSTQREQASLRIGGCLEQPGHSVDSAVASRISRSGRRCRPSWSKFSGASHFSNAFRIGGHSSAITEYQAVSRLRPL